MRAIRCLQTVLLKLPVCVVVTAVLLAIQVMFAGRASAARQRALQVAWARAVLWICRIRIRVHQSEEGLDPLRQYVFVSNHASRADIRALILAVPNHLCFLAKTSLFRWILVGSVPSRRTLFRRRPEFRTKRVGCRSDSGNDRSIEPGSRLRTTPWPAR